MAKARVLTHSLNAGEVSNSTLSRVDQEKARLWAETQENIFPFTIGKGMMRQGTTHLGEADDSTNVVRGIEFVKSLDAAAGLELSDLLLRVWVDDVLVTRASVTSTVTNGDFSSSVGWTLATSGDSVANINSTVAGALWMAVPNRGGVSSCTRSVTTSSAGTEHALRIVVTRGPVTFRCGSTSGGDDYIEETTLDTGTHSLAFTPSGTYHVFFSTRREPGVIVDSIQVEAAGVIEFTAPWTEAELFEIQDDQSGDIVYLTHINWQPRKVERRGDASWSLVEYKFEDGPFTTSRTSQIRLSPGATRGNATLTAESDFFRPEHVGALFRLVHDRGNREFGLGGDEVFTDAVRVSGIGTDNDFGVVRAGTWAGTLTLQRSIDGPDSGFVDTGTTYTTNGTTAFAPGTEFDNVVQWYRLGFKDGDYTSGSAQIIVGYGGDGGAGVCRAVFYVSPTQVSIEILSDFRIGNLFTDDWQEGEFSDVRGWPSAVAFHDGRLVFVREDKFRASESDNFTAFNLDTEGDSASIQRDIATSGAVFNSNALVPLSRLAILTDGAEVVARSDAFDTPLTPTNIALKNASTIGSKAAAPARIDKHGFYIARSGIKIYKLVYNFEQQDYDSDDATELHEDLGEDHDGFTELAVQRHPQPYMWVPMGDGECAILLTSPKHQISGWIRVITRGEVESVYVLPAVTEDRVYMWVKRTINGVTKRFHEKLCLRSEALGSATTKLADCGVFTAGPVSSVTAAHLINETGLVAWGTNSSTGVSGFIGTVSADGSTGSLSANGSGVVSLGGTYTNVFVGLPYRGRYKSAKLAYGAQGGTALLSQKRVAQIGLLLADVHRDAIKVGPSFTKLTKYTIKSDSGAALDDNEAVKAVHDAITQPLGGQWSTDSRVCCIVNAGHPATISCIVIDMET